MLFHPKTFIFSTLQKSPVDHSNGLLCAPIRCTFKQLLTSQHRLPVASHHTFQVISHMLFRQLCVGNSNNNRAYRGDIMVVQSLSEEHNLVVAIYLSWFYFTGEVWGKEQY
jgi:hypothetical protein